jgi:hypothetical protein
MDLNAIPLVTGVSDIPRAKKRRRLECYRADEGDNSFTLLLSMGENLDYFFLRAQYKLKASIT